MEQYTELELQAQAAFRKVAAPYLNSDKQLKFTSKFCQFDAYIIDYKTNRVSLHEIKKRGHQPTWDSFNAVWVEKYRGDQCEFKKINSFAHYVFNDTKQYLKPATLELIEDFELKEYKIEFFLTTIYSNSTYRTHNLKAALKTVAALDQKQVSKWITGLISSTGEQLNNNLELRWNKNIYNSGDRKEVDRLNLNITSIAQIKKYNN